MGEANAPFQNQRLKTEGSGRLRTVRLTSGRLLHPLKHGPGSFREFFLSFFEHAGVAGESPVGCGPLACGIFFEEGDKVEFHVSGDSLSLGGFPVFRGDLSGEPGPIPLGAEFSGEGDWLSGVVGDGETHGVHHGFALRRAGLGLSDG